MQQGQRIAPPSQRQHKQVTQGPCCTYGGDYWVRNCLVQKEKKNELLYLHKFYADCGIKNLAQECMKNANFKEKTALNSIEILKSQVLESLFQSKQAIHVEVIARDQAKEKNNYREH